MHDLSDTITAISTPIGEGALSIVRIAGIESKPIINQIFKHHNKSNFTPKPFTAHFGEIYTETETIDSVIFIYFPQPKSYTGQDQVEISCHGGYVVSKKILELIVSKGAHVALPGEFTYRAFLNGKLDLIQCEAVADIIQARTDISLQSALAQYEGHLSKQIMAFRNALIDTCSLIELELDFSSEDIQFVKRDHLIEQMYDLHSQLTVLVNSFRFGRLQREGVAIAIVGEPNVGKSSLLNRLLQVDRSIVTDVPGTTRDTVEESFDLNGMLAKLIDTAGIRNVSDKVEVIGIDRSKKAIQASDVVLLVVDVSQKLSQATENLFKSLNQEKTVFLIGNKMDLGKKTDLQVYTDRHAYISAINNLGIPELKEKLFETISSRTSNSPTYQITNIRHRDALERASCFLENAILSLQQKMTSDFIASDLRNSIEQLETIIGKVTSDDILNNIFSRFCVGK